MCPIRVSFQNMSWAAPIPYVQLPAHTGWHGLAHGQLGITPALAFSPLSASVLSFLPRGGVSTYLIRLENCLLILTRKARKRHCPLKGERGVPINDVEGRRKCWTGEVASDEELGEMSGETEQSQGH